MKPIYSLLSVAFLLSLCGSALAQQKITELSFKTLEHDAVQPFKDEDTKVVVLVFVSTDCPIANAYHPYLTKLYQRYQAKSVNFYLVHSSAEITVEAAEKHVKEYNLEIPVVLDRDQSLARRVSVTVTPEAVVLGRSENDPIYQGRIDNLYADYGKKRASATEHYLRDALDQFLAGENIKTRRTKPIGCFISFEDEGPAALDVGIKSDFVAIGFESRVRDYDPMKLNNDKVKTVDLDVVDQARERKIPIKVYTAVSSSDDRKPVPVILFSHGLGGSRNNNSYLGQQWSKRGYVVVFVQHVGSDESVWKDTPVLRRMNAMRKAANAENFQLRTGDIPAVIDQLEKWNKQQDHALYGMMDVSKIGMSGHSFGALTTQAVAGQTYFRQQRFLEKRIAASIAMSPSAPRAGNADAAFASITKPFLCMTGTKDTSPIGNATVESRLQVYESLPKGDKYQLVLKDGEHSAFGEGRLPGDKMRKNPNHHVLIKALSTAFWDAYLKGDKQAKQWLESDRPKSLLEEGDRWSAK